MKKLVLLLTIGLCFPIVFPIPARAESNNPPRVKELNFVFLHGAGSHPGAMQLLSDNIMKQIPAYISAYEEANPGVKIQVGMLERYYPSDVGVETWAENIASSIKDHFAGKQNLVLVGHSMGGKAALYLAAHNIGNLADKIAMVVTINSPVKNLSRYYVAGGVTLADYLQLQWLILDHGVSNSVANYDSSQDGNWVGQQKRWLAFISGETAPLSDQFDVGGIDPLPRDMDDIIIPISAQYSDGADVVYYGEHSHNDLERVDEVAVFLSEGILRYIFDGGVGCSVQERGANFERKAGWLPGTDYWEDVAGEVPVNSGSIRHVNESFTRWQEWEDVVGGYLTEDSRSSFQVTRSGLPVLTGIREERWMSSDNPMDCRLFIKSRAAPRSSIQVDWIAYRKGLLPYGIERDRYEVEIATGTPLTGIIGVSWLTDDPRDLRLMVSSEAERPFRWFKAQWRVYSKEIRQREVIDGIH